VKKPPAKKPIAKKPRSAAKLNATTVPAPPAPFWHRWPFRVLVGGAVAIATGAYSMVNIPAICPPGTLVCYHGHGPVRFDHDYFANVGRILGMDGGGSVSVSHTEVHNAPMP
jgi:hypothetical protein